MDLRPRMKLSNTESLRTTLEENSPRSVSDGLNRDYEIEDENPSKEEDPLEELTSHERDLASPFTEQNVALVFGNKDTVHDMLSLADEYQTDGLKKRIEKFLVTSALSKSDSITSEQIILDILEAEMYKLSDYLNASIAVASRKKFHSLTKSPKFEEISQTTQCKISFKRWEDIDNIFNKAVKSRTQFLQYQMNKMTKSGHPCGLLSSAPKQYEINIKDVGEQLKPYMKEN